MVERLVEDVEARGASVFSTSGLSQRAASIESDSDADDALAHEDSLCVTEIQTEKIEEILKRNRTLVQAMERELR